jgi:septum formation protein
MRLILASASPARLATLRAAGLDPEVVVSGVDESTMTAASPSELAQRLATAKAQAVASTPAAAGAGLVFGCDSILDLDGVAHGRPATPADAVRRWQEMRGRHGVLVTGHCVIEPASGREVVATAATTVHFANLSDTEIAAYVATGEPETVAGAFTIDGLGGAFVTRVEGDPHNVVGISLPLLRDLVHSLGTAWIDLWA